MLKTVMIVLEVNWIAKGVLDLEYKEYELLAYLQKIEGKFDDMKIYPYFSDLIKHYDYLKSLKSSEQLYKDGFPRILIDTTFHDTKLTYEDLNKDNSYINNIGVLIDFSINKIRSMISYGKFIYDEVEKCVDLLEMGYAKNNNLGYFILHGETIDVYEYELGELPKLNGAKGLVTKLVRSYPKGFHMSYESIRADLVDGSSIKNPSTFIIDTPINYPIEETLLPISKRLLVKKLSRPKIS